MTSNLLEVRDLRRHYGGRGWLGSVGNQVKAVDGVSLEVRRGETLAIVGESGCGKSTLARVIAGLDGATAGTVRISGQPVSARGVSRRDVARRVQIVFQDPFSSLNPRMRVEDIVAEPLEAQGMPREQRMQRVAQLFESVGLPDEARRRLPHQFSGGQRQRIAIARALSVEPDLLVLDEPVSALDVSVRAQILNLLASLKRERHISSVLISHDMSAVQHLADRVAVMYLGRLVEVGDAAQVFAEPAHPYTRTLLAAIPRLGGALPDASARVDVSPVPVSQGCSFAPRCSHAQPSCTEREPQLAMPVDSTRWVRCHRVSELPPMNLAQETEPAPGFTRRLAILRRGLVTRQ